MGKNLRVGITYTIEITVKQEDTATAYGSGGVDVFATPAMIALMENAAMTAAAPYLEEGYATVGTKVNISHLAATPVGMKATAKAEIIEIDGKKLVFKVEAYDEKELIGEGTHERYIINLEKFMGRVSGKGK